MALPGTRSIQVAVLISCVAGFGGIIAKGQTGSQPNLSVIPRAHTVAEALPRSTFRLDVKLIQVPVQVTDMRDRPIMGLRKGDFRLFEDDVEQEIVTFGMEDAPISTGLVFDASGSMRNRIEESRTAVDQFCRTAVTGDEFFLVKFSDKAELISPFTRSAGEILRQLNFIQPGGWTAMVDAIKLSVEEMRLAANPRKVLLVLSDGGDNNSRYSESELLSVLREADVRIYAIGLFQRPRYLEKLAEETGGKVIWVHKLSELPEAMETLSVQIRNEYVAGYFSNRSPNDGRYHRVKVEVQPPAGLKQVRASWRRGYVAP